MRSIEIGTAKRGTKNQNDYRRFIKKTSVTTDGEIADKNTFCLNTERIAEEERYDGYYAVVTNLESDPTEITDVLHEIFGFCTNYQIINRGNMKKF